MIDNILLSLSCQTCEAGAIGAGPPFVVAESQSARVQPPNHGRSCARFVAQSHSFAPAGMSYQPSSTPSQCHTVVVRSIQGKPQVL